MGWILFALLTFVYNFNKVLPVLYYGIVLYICCLLRYFCSGITEKLLD